MSWLRRVGEMMNVKFLDPDFNPECHMGAFVAAISGFCGYHFRKALLNKKTAC